MKRRVRNNPGSLNSTSAFGQERSGDPVLCCGLTGFMPKPMVNTNVLQPIGRKYF